MGFLTTGIELWRYRVKIKTRELEYDKVLSIKILAGSNCDIYYTLDGSVPTVESEVYSVPIRLEDGEHILSAICVNGEAFSP